MSKIIYKNLISPLGFTLLENFEAICMGQSGLKPNTNPLFTRKTFTATIAEEIINNHFAKYGDTKQYSKLEKLSIVAIQDILDKTGISPQDERTLLVYSTTKGNIDLMDVQDSNIPKERIALSEFKNVLQRFFNFVNTPMLVSNACVSGAQAILLADTLLKSNQYDHVIVVGGDLVSRFTLSGFSALNAISEQLCKPFDKNRNGINIGECCAGIVLTKISTSSETSATVVSGHSTVDAHHIVAPSHQGVGLTNAIARCLKDYDGSTIDFISAHGTSTVYNDEMEALSLTNNGLGNVPVFSLKRYYGHTLGAAGILETIISLTAMEKGCLVPSKGFETLGVSYPVNVIESLQHKEINCFLKTASGFGGVNTALLIQKG